MKMNATTISIAGLILALSLTVFQNCSTPPDQITPASSTASSTTPLSLTANSLSLAAGITEIFSASGGTKPYTYSVQSGCGQIDAQSGLFTAPATSSTCTVVVTDKVNATASFSVTVVATPVLPPTPTPSPAPVVTPVLANASPTTMSEALSVTLSASGGTPGYTYALAAGSPGTLSGNVLLTPNLPGTVVINVSDSAAQHTSLTLQIPPNAPQGTYANTCYSCTTTTSSTTLACTCNNVHGQGLSTSINYSTCALSSMTNNNGQLQCGN